MVQVVLALMLSVTGTNNIAEANNKPLTYEEAIQQSQKENKPILILVGAKWCSACELMKKDTIEPMKSAGELKDVIVTYVDKDERPELAQQLMKGESLPQTVMFCKDANQWRRLSLIGMQDKARMQELLARVKPAGDSQSKVVR